MQIRPVSGYRTIMNFFCLYEIKATVLKQHPTFLVSTQQIVHLHQWVHHAYSLILVFLIYQAYSVFILFYQNLL